MKSALSHYKRATAVAMGKSKRKGIIDDTNRSPSPAEYRLD